MFALEGENGFEMEVVKAGDEGACGEWSSMAIDASGKATISSDAPWRTPARTRSDSSLRPGCSDAAVPPRVQALTPNSLDGSLTESYDLAFDDTRRGSTSELAIEYVEDPQGAATVVLR